ncbi:hypothetical protein PINS_up005616 [Pythium insidiosum]|nr:hypothetical protein PINS_up005616 [Pythium insidiosum]
MYGDDHEEGEILEEGEEVEVLPPVKSAPLPPRAPPPVYGVPTPPPQPYHSATPPRFPREPTPPPHSQPYARKRPFGEMDHNGAPQTFRGSRPSSASSSSGGREMDEGYNEDLITRVPRQVLDSNVIPHFATWMYTATRRFRRRPDAENLQALLLSSVNGGDSSSIDAVANSTQYIQFPRATPKRVCVVLLGGVHPAIIQRYRPELPFFDRCTSLPFVIATPSQTKRTDKPLPELLYRFPKAPVNTREIPIEELFYGHELTFLMCHSFGYNDELILQPSGRFARKSQPRGGTWELDGDLLHLKWRFTHNTGDTSADNNAAQPIDDEEDEDYELDVLVSEDPSMHYFSTDPVTDKTYAREVPEHLATKRQRTGKEDRARSIRLSLIKATAADVPRAADGSLIRAKPQAETAQAQEGNGQAECDVAETSSEFSQRDFEEYVLTAEELEQHCFPIDLELEQAALLAETKNATRDVFVETQARPSSSSSSEESSLRVLALDCEMCETDLGMELTRVTVVNVQGDVVYDQLVKPQNLIINYHTEFSGITAEALQATRHILADVQRELLERFLFQDTVLVGHSLTSDLRALRIVHRRIADTSVLYPHQRGFPFKTSLKFLTKTFLGKSIQTKIQEGHDSAEDARAAMELLLLKIRRGPSFGIPEPLFVGGAFDSLADKLALNGKRMSMVKMDGASAGSSSNDADGNAEVDSGAAPAAKKPWHRYMCGELQTLNQSPIRARGSSYRKQARGRGERVFRCNPRSELGRAEGTSGAVLQA